MTAELVRDLLRDQHPDLAEQTIRLGARGWDNQLWRLGDDLAVRLPWATASADDLLRKEFAWLPALAPLLPLPVPVPQRLGEPTWRFPRPWLVTTWVPGEPGDRAPATRGTEAADSLAAFLTALHRPASAGAPSGRSRGGPLAGQADGFPYQLEMASELGLVPDPDGARAVWKDAGAAPDWAGPAAGRCCEPSPACSSETRVCTAVRAARPAGARLPRLCCAAWSPRRADDPAPRRLREDRVAICRILAAHRYTILTGTASAEAAGSGNVRGERATAPRRDQQPAVRRGGREVRGQRAPDGEAAAEAEAVPGSSRT